jgi:hypothetical protein
MDSHKRSQVVTGCEDFSEVGLPLLLLMNFLHDLPGIWNGDVEGTEVEVSKVFGKFQGQPLQMIYPLE